MVPPEWVLAGRVGRPHGLDGSFRVREPRIALLAHGSVVTVGERSARIARRAGTDDHPIVRLEGVEHREAAESLRGADLVVPRADAPPPGKDEWYAEDLEGCEVRDGERRVGVVTRLVPLPSCEALEVARPGADDLLVPLVHDAVRAVDVDARRIDVDLVFLAEA